MPVEAATRMPMSGGAGMHMGEHSCCPLLPNFVDSTIYSIVHFKNATRISARLPGAFELETLVKHYSADCMCCHAGC